MKDELGKDTARSETGRRLPPPQSRRGMGPRSYRAAGGLAEEKQWTRLREFKLLVVD